MEDKCLDRQLAQEAYARRLRQQPEAEKARLHVLEARLGRHGIAADLVGIPEGTAQELVGEWERLLVAYPSAAQLWQSLGPDVELTRLGGRQWLGYHGGVMLWHPGHIARPTELLSAEVAAASRQGKHPAGCGSLAAIACHEFGHVVEHAVLLRAGGAAMAQLCGELAKYHVSQYTVDRPEECFAVAFAAMHHGSSLSPAADQAVSILLRALRSVGM